jgi:hypothetical protein
MHISVAGLAVSFMAILELLVFFPEQGFSLFFLLFGFLIVVHFRIIQRFSWRDVLLFFFGVFAWGLLLFIDRRVEQHIFIVLVGGLFAGMLWGLSRWREGPLIGMTKSVLSAVTITSLFLFFSVIVAMLINYNFSMWLFAGCMGIGSYLCTYQYLVSIPGGRSRAKMYSFVVGVFFVEVGWMVPFWPFGYLTTGVILLILYYVLWDVLSSYIEGIFTRSRAWGDISLLVVLVSLVLFTTPWTLSQ